MLEGEVWMGLLRLVALTRVYSTSETMIQTRHDTKGSEPSMHLVQMFLWSNPHRAGVSGTMAVVPSSSPSSSSVITIRSPKASSSSSSTDVRPDKGTFDILFGLTGVSAMYEGRTAEEGSSWIGVGFQEAARDPNSRGLEGVAKMMVLGGLAGRVSDLRCDSAESTFI